MADYCTAAELRTQIELTGTTGSKSDAALGVVITATSRFLDGYYNRPDGFVALSVATARIYAGSGKPYQYIDECVEVSTVAVKDSASDSTYTTWAATDYIEFSGDPNAPNFNSLPYTALMVDPNGDYAVFTSGKFTTRGGFRPSSGIARGAPTVRIEAKWGYSVDVPEPINELTIALAARMFKQGQGAWMDTLASSDFGQLVYRPDNGDLKVMLDRLRYIKPALGRSY